MTETAVRAGELRDLPGLVAIYNHYILTSPATFDTEPHSVGERRAWFDQFAATGRYRLFVAEEDGEVAGFATSRRFREKAAYDTTIETSVYCAAGATGRGLGTRLYGALFEALAGEDLHAAIGAITQPNPASVALHRTFGFEPAGVLHEAGRKFGRYWDVANYEKRLG